MNQRPNNRPLLTVHSILTFTALSQILLYLWITGRITGDLAGSALMGVVLFGLLARAVREAVADQVSDVDESPAPLGAPGARRRT